MCPPCDYSKYHPDWKTVIRPDILKRANNCCEICKVKNYHHIFRGLLNGKEVYQYASLMVHDAETGELIGDGNYEEFFIEPIKGDPTQQSIKVVLTISHSDHNIKNNDYGNLKALCQQCHNRHDVHYRKANRNKNNLKLF